MPAGIAGGALVAVNMLGLNASSYLHSSYAAWCMRHRAGPHQALFLRLHYRPVGCFFGMRTTGGTQGVGRATTQAVVVSSVFIIVVTSSHPRHDRHLRQ